jgi:hypothetical protein
MADNEAMVVVETCLCNDRDGCNDERVDADDERQRLSCFTCGMIGRYALNCVPLVQ